jgi:kynurenine formamidase
VVFALNWSLDLPAPGFFGRGPIDHEVTDTGFGLDDRYDNFWPQRSSQWDSLAHFRHPRHGFYGNRQSIELKAPNARNGIDNLARRGIAARFVLADVARWRAHVGRPIDIPGAETVHIGDVADTLEYQQVSLRLGDILLVRFGWMEWYDGLTDMAREGIVAPPAAFAAVGLAPGDRTAAWLWDAGVVAIAADNPAVEVHPFDVSGQSLHADVLALLGVSVGELWRLDDLAADCAADGRYTGLLVSAPLNMPGGIGSPANAIALK